MSAYFEALEAHNAAHDGAKPSSLNNADKVERLRAFNAAHGVQV